MAVIHDTVARIGYGLLSKFGPFVCTRGGLRYRVDVTQLIDRNIFRSGFWEADTVHFITTQLHAGDVVIEVGANIGAHTLPIAKRVLPYGHVYAFEPTTFARNKLLENLNLNRALNNVTVLDNLVTDRSGSVPRREIRSSWNLSGTATPNEHVSSAPISIDEFAQNEKLEGLSLLKIDTDGYDFKVLSGASETIKRFRPLVLIELCDYALREQGNAVDDIFAFFSGMKYQASDAFGNPLSVAQIPESMNAVFTPA
jgi:FkbM family methyltransferase